MKRNKSQKKNIWRLMIALKKFDLKTLINYI